MKQCVVVKWKQASKPSLVISRKKNATKATKAFDISRKQKTQKKKEREERERKEEITTTTTFSFPTSMNLNTNSNSNNTFSNSSTTTIIEGTTEYTGVGYDNISINDNNGSGSAGGFFIRNDSFGSNNSETMMLPMNLGDNGMDDSAFALEDHHTMNPASFMDQQAVPCIPLTAATSTAAGTGGRTIDPMMLHTGVPTVVPPSSVDTKPSGIPPIISAEEMLEKTNANANANATTTTITTTNEHNTVGTTVQHTVSQLVLQQPQPQPQQPQQPQQQQQQQQLQTLQQITVYTGGDKLAKPEPRKKLWKCTFPGCTEPPKTHYNCYSHVWDSHIRHSLPQDNPLGAVVYKKIADKVQVKELCKQYMIELDDSNATKHIHIHT